MHEKTCKEQNVLYCTILIRIYSQGLQYSFPVVLGIQYTDTVLVPQRHNIDFDEHDEHKVHFTEGQLTSYNIELTASFHAKEFMYTL